jgi:hypothetical protein
MSVVRSKVGAAIQGVWFPQASPELAGRVFARSFCC